VAEAVLQLLIGTDVEGLIGAGRYERSGERTTWRNGTATGPSTPGSARCSCGSRSCGRAATSRRSDNVWHKPNPMPESTKDRCTSSHEYLFHLTNALGAGKIAVAIFYGLQLEICTP
jgi:hypothetical protein